MTCPGTGLPPGIAEPWHDGERRSPGRRHAGAAVGAEPRRGSAPLSRRPHIHPHLAVFVNGSERALPAGIGIVDPVAQATPHGDFDSASRCYYSVHFMPVTA